MVFDNVPQSSQHTLAEDSVRATKLIKEAEKIRKRQQEELRKSLEAESRRRAMETKQKR